MNENSEKYLIDINRKRFQTTAFNEPLDVLRARSVAMILPPVLDAFEVREQELKNNIENKLKQELIIMIESLVFDIINISELLIDEIIQNDEKGYRIYQLYNNNHNSENNNIKNNLNLGVVNPIKWPLDKIKNNNV